MKIYYYRVSTTTRPLMLFATESGFDVDFQVVDLLTGEHMKPDYALINRAVWCQHWRTVISA